MVARSRTGVARGRRRVRIRVAAGAASGGAAGGTKHVANVPGQQRLEGVSSKKRLEQVGQVCGEIDRLCMTFGEMARRMSTVRAVERVMRRSSRAPWRRHLTAFLTPRTRLGLPHQPCARSAWVMRRPS